MLYALTQPEREFLSNQYGTRTTQHMYDQVFNFPIALHVVHKSVEFSGVVSFTH